MTKPIPTCPSCGGCLCKECMSLSKRAKGRCPYCGKKLE